MFWKPVFSKSWLRIRLQCSISICFKFLTARWYVVTKDNLVEEVGGDRGVRVSRFPYHVLPPSVLLRPFISRLSPFIVLLYFCSRFPPPVLPRPALSRPPFPLRNKCWWPFSFCVCARNDCLEAKLTPERDFSMMFSGYPLALRLRLNFKRCSSNVSFEELVPGHVIVSPFLIPYFTSGRWHKAKCAN